MPYRAVHKHARRMGAIVDELAGIERIEDRWETPAVRAIIASLLKPLDMTSAA